MAPTVVAPPGGRWWRAAAAALVLASPAHLRAAPDAPAAVADPLALELEVRFTATGGVRTLLQAMVTLPAREAVRNEHGYYNLRLDGDVQVSGRSYDRFHYRFDVPAAESAAPVPLALAFERTLRPGRFVLVVRVEDLQSGRVGRLERTLEVPNLAGGAGAAVPAAAGADPSSALAAAVPAAAEPGVPPVRLVRPPAVVVGKHLFEAIVRSPQVAEVVFVLDGRTVLRRVSPPYMAELDVGREPVLRRLRVEARGAGGELLGSDQADLNAGAAERFAVRLATPSTSARRGRVTARAEVQAPRGQQVARVELFLDEQRVAVLQRPPFEGEVALGGTQPAVLRAVAYLSDGAAAEDSVLINSAHGAQVDVDLVELYAAVVDRRGRPVTGLPESRFRVVEEGRPQRVERFAEVRDLPLHVALLVDTSHSMTSRIDKVREAALGFLRQIVTPRDQVSLITFDNTPRVRVPFTGDFAFLANGLEGVRPSGSTALHDSLAFALEQFEGIAGQRVLVLLSDGVDEASSATAEEVMELARRSATTVYAIGLEDTSPQAPEIDRELLTRLAEETGGRAFFTGRPESLSSAYAEIEREVRSRYLLSYYSSQAADRTSFRLVNVEVSAPHLSARTIRGYYP
jgi:Ca-activated chloride channel family protein